MRRLGQVGGNYLLGRREGKGARNRVAEPGMPRQIRRTGPAPEVSHGMVGQAG
jgi:hypothetical protein